ncbi:MAG: lactate racemase domain-containing protein [Pirellulales bacterium]|nr:lactate racemase domain-containing protein [Pirellulales bacterium]
MPARLKYGQQSEILVPVDTSCRLTHYGLPTLAAVADLASTVQTALHHPRDFPPLAAATVPGDQIVLAVDPQLPQVATIVPAICKYLLAQNVDAARLTVLLDGAAQAQLAQLRQIWPAESSDAPTLALHHPDQRNDLGYLAADESAAPIYFNRRLLDADLIIPVGCASWTNSNSTTDLTGKTPVQRSLLYPEFSDLAARGRAINASLANLTKSPKPLKSAKPPKSGKAPEITHSPDWLLGVQFCVQVVPGPAGDVLAVSAGMLDSVCQWGADFGRQAWGAGLRTPVPLVIAGLNGATSSSWENVVLQLARYLQYVKRGGSLALYTDLSVMPPAGVLEWAQSGFADEVPEVLEREKVPGWQMAKILQNAREHARLALASELPEHLVSDLGWHPLVEDEDLQRLCETAASGCVFHHAEFVDLEPLPQPTAGRN